VRVTALGLARLLPPGCSRPARFGGFLLFNFAQACPVVIKRLPARVGRAPSRVAALPKKVERFYASPEWKRYRSAHRAWTKAKQGGVWCCVCGSTERLILDHVVERRDGGPDLPPYEGAKWYCTGCHNAKTAAARARRAGGA